MLKRTTLARLALLVAGLLFAAAIIHLLQLRSQYGDVYPKYSSLRSDPLGARVLYEALDDLPDCAATRNFHPLSKIAPNARTTLYFLGANGAAATSDKALLVLAESSARVIYTLLPAPVAEATPTPSPSPSPDPTPAEEEDEPKTGDAFDFELKNKRLGKEATTELAGLPHQIPWHSAAYFAALGKHWRVIYRSGGEPVMIERQFGRGSIVVASDSYLLSNEAMLKDRQPALLAWLNGAGTQIIFDETHLAVEEHDGIATLFRKYRLLGLLGALAALAVLFAWRQASSLVPPFHELNESEAPLTGRDAQSGFISLLRRSVPPREVLATCLTEWERSQERPLPPAPRAKMDTALHEAATKPVATYQILHKILTETSR